MQQPAAAPPGSSRFALLGPVQAVVGGELARLGGPRQVAVLARLLLSPGQVVSLDQLVESVWDGDAPNRPEVTIRSYISNLRRSLEPDRPRGDPRSCIESRNPGYRLTVEPDRIDAVRFETLIGEGRVLLDRGQLRRALERLDAARGLWRGVALDGVVPTATFTAHRARLTELHRGATEALFEARLQLGEHDAVLPDLEAAVAGDPLRERLSELAMRALYAAGRQSDALALYRQLRGRLVDELGVDPGPVVRDLEHKILTQDASLTPRRPDWHTVRRPVPGPAAPGGGRRRPAGAGNDALLGRGRERDRLRTIHSALAAGHGAAALITGEPGSGKTALVDDLVRRLEHDGVSVVWGRCRPLASGEPLWPWTQLLDGLVPLAGPGQLDDLGALRSLSPSFHHPELHAPADGDQHRRGDPAPGTGVGPVPLFTPVTELLRRIAGSRPLVVVVEDAHWADLATIELVAHAGAALGDAPVAFVVTWRNTERTPRPRQRALRDLIRLPTAIRIELRGLNLRSAEQLVARHRADPALAHRLHWASAGNPLLLTELVSVSGPAPTGPTPPPERAGPFPAPTPTVIDAVLSRIDRIHPRAVDVLSVAALTTSSFQADAVALAGGYEIPEVLSVLDRGAEAGIVVGGPGHGYLFVHPVTRTVLASRIPGPRRARLHAALGRALWHTGGPNAELAYHFSRAGSAPSTVLAARFALEAASDLTDPGGVAHAAEAAAGGLAALDQLGRADVPEAALATLLAHLARLRGDQPRFVESARRALAAAGRAGDDDQLVAAVLAACGADAGSGGPGEIDWLGRRPDPDRAVRLIDELLGRLAPDHRELPLLLARRATLQALSAAAPATPPTRSRSASGDTGTQGSPSPTAAGATATGRTRSGAEPLDLLPPSSNTVVDRLGLEMERARLLTGRATTEARLAAAERLLSPAPARGYRPRPLLLAVRLRVLAHLESGSAPAAVTALDDARVLLRADDGLSRLGLDSVEIDLALLQGRLDDAQARLDTARRLCGTAGLHPGVLDRQLAALSWLRGDLDRCERLLESTLSPDSRVDGIDRSILGAALAGERGDAATARRLLDELVTADEWPTAVTGHPYLERAALVAQAADVCGHEAAAGTVAPVLTDRPGALVTAEWGCVASGTAAYYGALAVRTLGRYHEARRLLADSEQHCRDIQARTCLVKTLVAQAQLAARRPRTPGPLDPPAIELEVGDDVSVLVDLELRSLVDDALREARELAAEIAMGWNGLSHRI